MKVSDTERWEAVFFLAVMMMFCTIFRLVFYGDFVRCTALILIYFLFACYFNSKIKKKGESMIKINDKINDEEVNDVLNQCADSEEEGASRWPGMSYEQGVKAAIEWLQGYGENPMED